MLSVAAQYKMHTERLVTVSVPSGQITDDDSHNFLHVHIPSMPVSNCLTSQLQSHVMSIDCSLVCVHLVLVCW